METQAMVRFFYPAGEIPQPGRPQKVRSVWDGPRTGVAFIEYAVIAMHGGDPNAPIVRELYWPLLKVGESVKRCGGYYVRLDAHRWLLGWLHRQRFRFRRWQEKIQYRLLRTLEIWNLATIPPGHVPCWNDIHWPWRAKR